MMLFVFFFSFSVCLNAEISTIINARASKFGMNISRHYTHMELNLNFGCHTRRLRKSKNTIFKQIILRNFSNCIVFGIKVLCLLTYFVFLGPLPFFKIKKSSIICT